MEKAAICPLEAGFNGTVTFEYLPFVNFALSHNGCRQVLRCTVANNGTEAMRDVKAILAGPMLKECHAEASVVDAGAEIDLSHNLQLAVDASALIGLSEGIKTNFILTITIAGETAYTKEYPLELMPYEQWFGIGLRPELIAAFVTPNQPMLSRVGVAASAILEKRTGNGALDEYQSLDPNRVRQQVAAIYEAIRQEGLVYATPPAGFQKTGQRVRLADRVLSEKLGTCLDLTLLFASCLEALGINPLIVFTKDHCFVGAWLVRDSYAKPVGDDPEFLLKSSADGINEIVLFETTTVTSAQPVSFDDAVAEAQSTLRKGLCECFVDVARARVCGVRPVPVRVRKGDEWIVENDGADRAATTDRVRNYDRYDLTEYNTDGAKVTKYTIWERKLLDFSLRNNLLNMHLGKKMLPLVSFGVDRLEDLLQEHHNFSVLPFPLDKEPETADEGIYDSALYPQLEEHVISQYEHHRIHSFRNETDLRESLKYLYRSSRTALEENGANNLYMVFGLLKWYETDRSSQPRFAPLLLLPLEIVRRGGVVGYEIRCRDEEMMINITLAELLRQQYDIDLTGLEELPRDASGVDIKLIFSIIRDKIKGKKGWNVLDETIIGLFSFNKFVMWNDIHSNSRVMQQNPIVSSLVEGKLAIPTDEAEIDSKNADIDHRPDEFTIPIDVDSSQLEAVIASGAGRTFVLHGPPGTGKSQTITNMIANALYQGKRVLFVAEKMAALSVVQSRLEKIGLAPFCLELHSNKVTKQHFLRQMETALNVVRHKTPDHYAADAEDLYVTRSGLIATIDALHGKAENGLSLYDCITGYIAIPGDAIEPAADTPMDLGIRAIDKAAEDILATDAVRRVIGDPSANPLQGLLVTDSSAAAEQTMRAAMAAVIPAINSWQMLKPQMARALGWEATDTRADVDRLAATLAALTDADAARRRLSVQYSPAILGLNPAHIDAEWREINGKWALPRYFARKKMLKRMSAYKPGFNAADIDTVIRDLSVITSTTATYGQQSDSILSLLGQMVQAGNTVLSAIDTIGTVARITIPVSSWATDLLPAMQTWNDGMDRFCDWYLWSKAVTPLYDRGVGYVVDYIYRSGADGSETALAFRKGYYKAMAQHMINADERLRHFNGILFDDTIATYRRLTNAFQQLSKEELYCRLASAIPSMTMEAHESSEIGILKRNIKNGGRGTSIRKLIDQIPTLLPRLCPCMLMSPLSVAQYIAMDGRKFDLVIFDEASQMPTSEAVGAIARGDALVVVGDPKQMPPTSFFATSAVSEEEAAIDDMESILDDCISLSIPSKYLSWHYRSRHESLITFSNSQYYDGRLTTFPSVDDRVSKVTLRRIEGVYDKGKTRSNKAEAQAVVDEVIRRLSDPELKKQSIGIVSFSKVQQDMIEDLLTDALDKQQDLAQIAWESAEPIFVKNLENVQGDERDVILFSVGYGPDKDGKVSMNFGPLNNAGGERRLNVAVSRARCEMMVFTSLHPEQIDLRRTSALGVEGLRKFLEFAETGRVPQTSTQSVPVDDTIARDIAARLQRAGYDTRLAVGRSQFKIDVAVVNPDKPSEFKLGILLDGPGYYATKTMRDREVVQPGVLQRLDWDIMRVWTLDWFNRSESVMNTIIERLKNGRPEPDPEPEQPVFKSVPQPASEVEQAPVKSIGRPYSEASLAPAKFDIDVLEKRPATIETTVRTVVATEAPVSRRVLYQRVVKRYGVPRMFPRLRDLVDRVVAMQGVYTTPGWSEGDVLWPNAAAVREFTDYRTGGDREIRDVPVEEICNAMMYVMSQQLSIDRDGLKRVTMRELGYSRLNQNTDAAAEAALSRLLDAGRLNASGNRVSIP